MPEIPISCRDRKNYCGVCILTWRRTEERVLISSREWKTEYLKKKKKKINFNPGLNKEIIKVSSSPEVVTA